MRTTASTRSSSEAQPPPRAGVSRVAGEAPLRSGPFADSGNQRFAGDVDHHTLYQRALADLVAEPLDVPVSKEARL